MINSIVYKGFDRVLGADIYVFAAVSMLLDEVPLAEYLTKQ